jgi:hypothetical protein
MTERHKNIVPVRNFKFPAEDVLLEVDRKTLDSLPTETVYESPSSFFAITEDAIFQCPKGDPETLKVKSLTVNPEQPLIQLDVEGLKRIASRNNLPILETDLQLWVLGSQVFFAEKEKVKK